MASIIHINSVSAGDYYINTEFIATVFSEPFDNYTTIILSSGFKIVTKMPTYDIITLMGSIAN